MRFVVFHSRTGAAALAAALQSVGTASSEDYRERLGQLPLRGEWLLCCQTAEQTTLAAASGAEPWVLEQALRCLTATFATEAEIEFLPCSESRHLVWPMRFWRWRLLPATLASRISRRVWQEALAEKGEGIVAGDLFLLGQRPLVGDSSCRASKPAANR